MIPSWARVGAKVVCIRADWTNLERAEFPEQQWPVEGETYTIREITTTYSPGLADVRLVEIENPVVWCIEGPAEQAFAIERFRPLVTIEDDLKAHFAHHLTTSSPQGVDA